MLLKYFVFLYMLSNIVKMLLLECKLYDKMKVKSYGERFLIKKKCYFISS